MFETSIITPVSNFLCELFFRCFGRSILWFLLGRVIAKFFFRLLSVSCAVDRRFPKAPPLICNVRSSQNQKLCDKQKKKGNRKEEKKTTSPSREGWRTHAHTHRHTQSHTLIHKRIFLGSDNTVGPHLASQFEEKKKLCCQRIQIRIILLWYV